MVQGGDPTGTGKGGESIYGKPFRDEIHTRIKFNHRGQVAMANENQPGTNHSQFFYTLDNAPHLDKKHTIFGKVGLCLCFWWAGGRESVLFFLMSLSFFVFVFACLHIVDVVVVVVDCHTSSRRDLGNLGACYV